MPILAYKQKNQGIIPTGNRASRVSAAFTSSRYIKALYHRRHLMNDLKLIKYLPIKVTLEINDFAYDFAGC